MGNEQMLDPGGVSVSGPVTFARRRGTFGFWNMEEGNDLIERFVVH